MPYKSGLSPGKKPTLEQYPRWLASSKIAKIDDIAENHYDQASKALLDCFECSPFWMTVVANLPELEDKYFSLRGVNLLMKTTSPEVKTKPYSSIVDKSYRKNVLLNNAWPDPPPTGWVIPYLDWLTLTNDVVRTCFVVKYLDGIEFFIQELAKLAKSLGISLEIDYEAREEGYYAAHAYPTFTAKVVRKGWDKVDVRFTPELQVTTQLQDVINNLTHRFYERRRLQPRELNSKWQWDYRSDQFKATYLSHTLHHLEGLIVELTEKNR